MVRFLLLLTVSLAALSRAEATPAPKTIVVSLGDIADITGQRAADPLRQLASLLKQNSKSRCFRLIWDDSAGNFNASNTTLYDRKTRVLKFYSNTSIGGLGNEIVTNEIKSWMFSGVNDSIIYQLNRRHRGTLDSDKGTVFDGASFFSELDSYGARRRDLGSHQVLSNFGKSKRRPKQQ